MRKLFPYSGFGLFIIALFFIFFQNICFSSQKDLLSCDQINSNYVIPYCVYILKEKRLLNTKQFVFISLKDNDYGEMINYPQTSYNSIETTKVEWLDSGVRIVTPLGYEPFIKKEKYEANR